MTNEPKTVETTNMFNIICDLEEASVIVNRVTGMLNLLSDALEGDIKHNPYSQYYLDQVYACRQFTYESHKNIDTSASRLTTIWQAMRNEGAA